MTEPAPRTQQEMAALAAICRACGQWDAATGGCKLFRSCERKALTRSLWRLGHCPRRNDRKW